MKFLSRLRLLRVAATAAVASAFLLLPARAAAAVGTYDSRVVAYACFWETGNQASLQALLQEGRVARDRGDTRRHREIEKEIKARQKALHLQVFSTAPCPGALAALGSRVDAVCREAGVTRLVSRWDADGLKGVPAAERIDVTTLLVRDLPLTEKQRTVMRELAAKEPLPLWKARALAAFGQL